MDSNPRMTRSPMSRNPATQTHTMPSTPVRHEPQWPLPLVVHMEAAYK